MRLEVVNGNHPNADGIKSCRSTRNPKPSRKRFAAASSDANTADRRLGHLLLGQERLPVLAKIPSMANRRIRLVGHPASPPLPVVTFRVPPIFLFVFHIAQPPPPVCCTLCTPGP